jgi:hypothetical protein
MSGINRFSSRRERLDHAYLANRLRGAKSYIRIAGYFRSSIFELAGEQIAGIPEVRIVCNSELDAADITISKHVRETALKQKWNEVSAEVEALLYRDRYRQLHELLTSGRVKIRVVPKDRVFVHGKAGVIEAADGSKTCFLGSINETKSAFAQNYEILWEDTSPGGVEWVEEEFEALWKDSFPLPDAIAEEIQRVAERTEVRFAEVKPPELAGAALAESPIYRGGEQLQPWQRAFVTRTRGAEDIAHCPFRIAIVSTGLIFHRSDEFRILLEQKFGTVVLDEAHGARRSGGLGNRKAEPNNLL